MKSLIDALVADGPPIAKYVARLKVRGEYLVHHVREQEGALFRALAEQPLPWQDLEARMAARREELTGARGAASPPAGARCRPATAQNW